MGTVTETLDVIASRFSARSYLDRPLPADVFAAITQAGLQAPSAMNRQPWRLVAISDPALIARIDASGLAALREGDPDGYARIQSRGGRLLYGAPAMVVIAVQPQPGLLSTDLDVGIVASHLVLAARSLGVDSCICGLAGLAFAGPDGPGLLAALGVPDGFGFGLSVLLGYASVTGEPHRPDPAKLIELPAPQG